MILIRKIETEYLTKSEILEVKIRVAPATVEYFPSEKLRKSNVKLPINIKTPRSFGPRGRVHEVI